MTTGRVNQIDSGTVQRPQEKAKGNGYPRPSKEPTPEKLLIPERNMAICTFCRNSLRECCLTKCAPVRTFVKLEPIPLADIPFLPRLPSFEKVVRWTNNEHRAMTYLIMFYLLAQEKERRT